MKRVVSSLFAALLLSAGLVATAAPDAAEAAPRNGNCDAGEFCLYYNSNHQGAVSDFTTSVPNYGTTTPTCYVYKGSGNGAGKCIKNDAASAWNRTSGNVTLYYNSNYSGASQTFAPGAKINLNSTLKNNNASHQLSTGGGTTPPPPTGQRVNMSYGLYNLSGGRITAAFDGYRNTPGRHEGIDIARGLNSPVRALLPGQVINIVNGRTGSGGLSTIAVYNAEFNRTVIYLHSAPLSGLRVGQNVSRGQHIANESWRGVSSSSGTHTHVELRNGRQSYAAKSVNDWTLDNPNPNSFWQARGYNIN